MPSRTWQAGWWLMTLLFFDIPCWIAEKRRSLWR